MCSPTKWFWREKKLLFIMSISQFSNYVHIQFILVPTKYLDRLVILMFLYYMEKSLPSFDTFTFGARITVPSDSVSHEFSKSSVFIQGNSIQLTSPADCRMKLMDASSTFSRSIILYPVKKKGSMVLSQNSSDDPFLFAPEFLMSCYKIVLKH